MQVALPPEEKKPEDWEIFQMALAEHQISFEVLDPCHELGVLIYLPVEDPQQQQLVLDILKLSFLYKYA